MSKRKLKRWHKIAGGLWIFLITFLAVFSGGQVSSWLDLILIILLFGLLPVVVIWGLLIYFS